MRVTLELLQEPQARHRREHAALPQQHATCTSNVHTHLLLVKEKVYPLQCSDNYILHELVGDTLLSELFLLVSDYAICNNENFLTLKLHQCFTGMTWYMCSLFQKLYKC